VAGRMLRCVCLRLSTTQVRRRRHLRRRGSETGVVQAAWCRGRGSGAAADRPTGLAMSDLCVFVGCSEVCP